MQVGATSISVLRSVWQTYWLHENQKSQDSALDQLVRSLSELENSFDEFIQLLNQSGWDTNDIKLRVPKEVCIDESDPV